MSKPKGMSRKDYHNLKAIVRDYLEPTVIVQFSWDGVASGILHERHDEGFNNRFVEVSLGDKPGTYSVSEQSWGKDCDGRQSSESTFTVGERGKRKRWYNSRNYQTDRPTGKFGMKSRWKPIGEGSCSQRDYSAEAAGY